MSIEITAGEDLSAETWNQLVARSSTETPFHHYAALETIAEYADATLHTLIGYKGQEPVGVFPLFEKSKGPVSVVLSPPPGLQIPYLGPLSLNTGELKRRRRDVRHHRFIKAATEWTEEQIAPRFSNIQTSAGYTDVRPFIWKGYDAVPRYTYEVDLPSDPSELLARFSRYARTNIHDEYEYDWTITESERSEIDRIITQVRERYEDQGESFSLPTAFLHDLQDRLPNGSIRQYVCRIDGAFGGGIITVETDSTVYGWLGGAKTDVDLPVNDLLNWHICKDAIDRGLGQYDLVGGNHERIYRYKAKFAPDLRTYYNLQKGTRDMEIAAKIYRYLQR